MTHVIKRLCSCLWLCIIVLVLPGCSSFQGCAVQEPVAVDDAIPPPEYHPIFLRDIADVNTALAKKPYLDLRHIACDSAQRVTMTLQLNDTLGAFLYGAAAPMQKKLWCEIVDQVGDEKRIVKDFDIQEITEMDRVPHAVAVVIDNSGSMGENRALATQDAAAALIRMKKPEDMMSIIRYDKNVGVEVPLTLDPATLQAQLKHDGLFGYGGATAIANGINTGLDVLESAPAGFTRSMMVITDGVDNSSTIALDTVLARARSMHVSIHTVDFGNGVARGYMDNIAQNTGGNYQKMYRTVDFPAVFEDVYRKIKNSYVLKFKTDMYGDHQVSVHMCFPRDSALVVGQFTNAPKVGDLSLIDVYFDSNKSDLKAESKAAIDKVYKLMRSFPTIRIEIRGHTDANNSTGDADHNKKLSQRRADAVLADLVKRGIVPERISAKGFGDTVPVSDNTTPEGRAKNRRTEFLIVAK